MQDSSGEALYKAVQTAVDGARAEGADYVYVMGHLGDENADAPYTYADVVAHTNGIDVFLDGHSHDLEQVEMKNKDGKKVVRSACGAKLQAIGYSELSSAEGVVDTGIWVWNNKQSITELMGIDNDIKKKVDSAIDDLGRKLDEVIGICGGANVRANIDKGDITYGKILEVFPFNNEMCMIEVTGQQILDALEWGSSRLPGEFGGFMQVSGLTYEIDMNVPSPCTQSEDGLFTGISGERRVKNVTVGGKALDRRYR